MRLIDADALKNEVDNFQNCYNGWSDTYDKAYIIGAIEEAPTIDAIPIEQYRSMENTCYKLQKALYEMADRKTENSSEKPNNCEKDCFLCKWLGDVDVCGRCRNRNLFAEADTEPTSSKMEQVEPQTCSFSDCDNFKNPDYERCIECKRKQIKLKTEQTERDGE